MRSLVVMSSSKKEKIPFLQFGYIHLENLLPGPVLFSIFDDGRKVFTLIWWGGSDDQPQDAIKALLKLQFNIPSIYLLLPGRD